MPFPPSALGDGLVGGQLRANGRDGQLARLRILGVTLGLNVSNRSRYDNPAAGVAPPSHASAPGHTTHHTIETLSTGTAPAR
jgi:hypothetical protein